MPDTTERRRNGALWIGVLLALPGFLSNGLTFLGFPAAAVPWISLVLPVIGAGLVFLGLWRAFRRSGIYRGKFVGTSPPWSPCCCWAYPSPSSGELVTFRRSRLALPRSASVFRTSPSPTAAGTQFLSPSYLTLRPGIPRQKPCCSFFIADTGDLTATSSCEASKRVFPSLKAKGSARLRLVSIHRMSPKNGFWSIAPGSSAGKISLKTFVSGPERSNCWPPHARSNNHLPTKSKEPEPLLVPALCVGWLPG